MDITPEGRAYAHELHARRVAAGLTIDALAGAAGVDPERLGRIERSEIVMTTLDLSSLSRALGVTVAEVAAGAEQRMQAPGPKWE